MREVLDEDARWWNEGVLEVEVLRGLPEGRVDGATAELWCGHD